MTDFYTRKDLNNETIELTITVPKEELDREYSSLLKEELGKTNLKGFRKGKVPTDFIEPHVGEAIKVQAFEQLVPMLVNTALQKENLEPIAPPEYKDFPDFKSDELVFTMAITILPEFKLGEMKKVKVEKEKVKVEKKEIDEALDNILKSQETKAKEINEEWAKEIIDLLKLEDVKDLKGIRQHIEDLIMKQKEHYASHMLEDKALDEAIKVSDIKIPEPAIKFEAEEREKAFINDMQQKGIKIDDFLKANNITIEKMRELWLKDAKQALESDVFLRIYIKERDIKITDEDLKKKIEEIKKGAPQETDKSIFDNEKWQEYIRRVEEKEQGFKAFIKEVLGE